MKILSVFLFILLDFRLKFRYYILQEFEVVFRKNKVKV